MKSGILGILSAVFASVCCVLPLLLALIGLGMGAVLGRYHWLFLGIGVLLIVIAWIYYFKERKAWMRNKRLTQVVLIIASVVVAFFVIWSLYPYISKSCCITP